MERHGYKNTPTYKSWCKMKERCDNPNGNRASSYFAKGITYDERWNSFTLFLEDMGERPADKSLDRINNKEGYSKNNCRWASASEQASNTTRNAYYLINGMQYCQEQAARALNITTKTIRGMRRRNDFPNHVQFIGHINA